MTPFLSICLSVCLSVCQYTRLSLFLSVCQSIRLSLFLSVCLSISLPISLFEYVGEVFQEIFHSLFLYSIPLFRHLDFPSFSRRQYFYYIWSISTNGFYSPPPIHPIIHTSIEEYGPRNTLLLFFHTNSNVELFPPFLN